MQARFRFEWNKMALSLFSFRTGNLTSFARLETAHIYYHQRSNMFNLRFPVQKAAVTDPFAFLSERHEAVTSKRRSDYMRGYRPGRYGMCGVCANHAAAREKVLMADEKMDQRTFYDMLGVSRKAEAKDIKAAYRQQVRRLHPDVAPLDKRKEFTTAFLKIQAAYTTLANPRSRAWYDSQLTLKPYHACADMDGKHFGALSSSHESTCVTAAETATAYPWARASSNWKGRNWETDQCW